MALVGRAAAALHGIRHSAKYCQATRSILCDAEGLVGATKIVPTHGTMPSAPSQLYMVRYFFYTVYGIYMPSKISRSVILHPCDIYKFWIFVSYTMDLKMNSGAQCVCQYGPHAYIICAYTFATAHLIYTLGGYNFPERWEMPKAKALIQ